MNPPCATPFLLHLTDGRTWHGAQFPTGHIAVNHIDHPGGAFTVAISLDALLADRAPADPLAGARVEWPAGTPQGAQG